MTIHMIESFHANKEETYIHPPLQLKIFFGILFFVVETLGNFLLFCLIIYEKYGMDGQKRTATNQLLSGLCCSVIFFNVGILPLNMTVNIFEPQSESNILNRLSPQRSWAVVQREKKYMAYDLHPVLIPYLVSQNSSKSKFFNEPFLSNCDFRVFPLYAHSRFQGFNL